MLRLTLVLIILLLSACQTHTRAEDEAKTDSARSNTIILPNNRSNPLGQDILNLGQPVDMTLLQPLNNVLSNPESYVDQRVTIKGKIDKACKKKGCWADIVAGDDTIRVKVADDVIVIPLYKIGHDVYATGVLKRYEMSLKESIAHQKHMAQDAGEVFDPASVKTPLSFYQLESNAIMIL